MFSASGDGSEGKKVGKNVLCEHVQFNVPIECNSHPSPPSGASATCKTWGPSRRCVLSEISCIWTSPPQSRYKRKRSSFFLPSLLILNQQFKRYRELYPVRLADWIVYVDDCGGSSGAIKSFLSTRNQRSKYLWDTVTHPVWGHKGMDMVLLMLSLTFSGSPWPCLKSLPCDWCRYLS